MLSLRQLANATIAAPNVKRKRTFVAVAAVFAKANNLLDQEIRQHASFLKDSSVAGERSILIGARADF